MVQGLEGRKAADHVGILEKSILGRANVLRPELFTEEQFGGRVAGGEKAREYLQDIRSQS